MKKIYIYKLTNRINNHSYIGQTNNIFKRLFGHLNSKYLIGIALRKYEPINFKIEILWVTIDKQTANCIEIAAINYYNCLVPNGYNIMKGGNRLELYGKYNGMFGKHHSKETKQHWSKIRKGKNYHKKKQIRSEEHKRKIGEANKKINWTEERRKKMARYGNQNARGHKWSIKTRIKRYENKIKKLEKELKDMKIKLKN